MIEYLIGRGHDHRRERWWHMSETTAVPYGGRQDILTLPDGLTIRVVLVFKAPSWGDARKVYQWAVQNLKRRVINTPLDWGRVQTLIQ